MAITLEETETKQLREHKGQTYFLGCSCYKDCDCSSEFIPKLYHYYSVLRIKKRKDGANRMKQYKFETFEQAKEKYNTLP